MVSKQLPFTRIELGLMLDGCGGPGVRHAALLIRDGRIIEAGPSVTVSRPDSAELFAFPTSTALPGLIDCHAHLTMPGDGTSVEAVATEDERISTLRASENARVCLNTGVTTVADCGAPGRSMFALRDALAGGITCGPRLFICGRALTMTGGHGWPFGGETDGVNGVRRAIRTLMKDKVDFIKLMTSGGSTRTTRRYQPAFAADELRAAVEETHAWGRIVIAHATSVSAITACLEAGVDVLAHATFYEPKLPRTVWPSAGDSVDDFGQFIFSPDIAERIAARYVPVVPTLWTNRVRVTRMEKLAAQGPLSEVENRELARRRRTYDERCANFRGLAAAGVTLAVGSDAGWGPPFGTLHEELAAMSEAGLGPAGAILAATRDAARTLGIDEIVGTLEPNKLADVIVVNGDPARDIKAVGRIEAVFLGGRRVI